jgi:hypothetical protein
MRTSSGEGRTMSLSSQKIFFEDVDGFFSRRRFFLDIKGKDTIAKVKTEIGLRTRRPKDALELCWLDRVLDDKSTVDQCRIDDRDVLFFCERR